MDTPTSKTVPFRFALAGVVSKESPDLLKDGQYRSLSNVCSNQEGSLSSLVGPKKVGGPIGSGSNLPVCYHLRKLAVTQNENPLAPNTDMDGNALAHANPRYLGILTSGGARKLYRSPDYQNLDNGTAPVVSADIDASADRHWEMAEYAAGESGAPWAYIASATGMYKDAGLSPYNALPKWGLPAATGVCLAAAVTGTVTIDSVINSLPTWNGIIIVTHDPVALSDDDYITITGTGLTVTTTDGRTALDGSAWGVRIGNPDAEFKNIFNKTTHFRLFDNNGQVVQCSDTYTSGGSITGVALAGNLDGGAESSPNDTQKYDWVMVYEETVTGDYGNPSRLMSANGTATVTDTGVDYSCQQLAIHGGQAKVLVWYVNDARIGHIRVYRRGGTLSDMVGRLVARIPNAYNISNTQAQNYTIITDNVADDDLVYQEQWTTDNFPPVVSSPPSPITATPTAAISAGWQTVTLTGTPFSSLAPQPGNLVHVIDSAGVNEDVYITAATTGSGTTSITAFFQFSHATAASVSITVDAIYGQPCHLAITSAANGAILVAGDPSNPHMLYKSKNGAPQAFPIGIDAAGAIATVIVGTPSNGIVNMTECRGQVLCLNISGLFEVAVLQGSLTQPAQVADKGLKGQSAWCKTATEEVWFLSDDGIYSWNGAFFQKRSEAIDPIFHDQKINGIPPIDMTATTWCRMAYRRGIIHFLYVNVDGDFCEITCDPLYGNRWVPVSQELDSYPNTMLFTEPDTQSLIVASSGWDVPIGSGSPYQGASFGIADVTLESGGTNLTSNWWYYSPQGDGTAVDWDVWLPWFDMGDPTVLKLFEEVWLDLDPQLYDSYGVTPSISVELLLDYVDTAIETFSIPIVSGHSRTGRQLVSLLPNLVNTSGSIYQSYGREARAISFHISGSAFPVQVALYQILIQFQPTGRISAGSASDWMELGNSHDARLYQMKVLFDTAGTDRTLVLETRGGRDGKTAGTAQTFTLSSPTDLYSGRCMKIFPLADRTIAKLARVRPYAASDQWRILEVSFPDAEQYPPDVVNVTPWDKGGSEFLKYANQLTLEVNTNNVAVIIQLQADGSNIGPTFTVTSTEQDRQRNITLPPGLSGYRWRVTCDPTQAAIASAAGMFQLFSHSFKFQQADKGEVGHTFDWDDQGHPWDKRLQVVNVEWDNTGGAAVTLTMDILKGLDGGTLQSGVATLSLGAGSGRSQKAFEMSDGIICKKLRIYPTGSTIPEGFKDWKYTIKFEPFPPDRVLFTEPQAFSPYEGIARVLNLKIDTGGVACAVSLYGDGVLQDGPYSVSSSLDDWKRVIAVTSNKIAKLWKLALSPGTNGKSQLFEWSLDVVAEPPALTEWNSYQQSLGYLGYKFIEEIWLEYICLGPVTFTVVSDTGTYSTTLSPHGTRSVERFYPGTVWGAGLNKSRLYSFSFSSPFTAVKMYADCSGVRWFACDAGRSGDYQGTPLSELMKLTA